MIFCNGPLCLHSPNEKEMAYVNTDIKTEVWLILLGRNVLFCILIMHYKHRLHDLINITAWCAVWEMCVNVFRGVCGVIDDICSVMRPCKVLFVCVSECVSSWAFYLLDIKFLWHAQLRDGGQSWKRTGKQGVYSLSGRQRHCVYIKHNLPLWYTRPLPKKVRWISRKDERFLRPYSSVNTFCAETDKLNLSIIFSHHHY